MKFGGVMGVAAVVEVTEETIEMSTALVEYLDR